MPPHTTALNCTVGSAYEEGRSDLANNSTLPAECAGSPTYDVRWRLRTKGRRLCRKWEREERIAATVALEFRHASHAQRLHVYAHRGQVSDGERRSARMPGRSARAARRTSTPSRDSGERVADGVDHELQIVGLADDLQGVCLANQLVERGLVGSGEHEAAPLHGLQVPHEAQERPVGLVGW